MYLFYYYSSKIPIALVEDSDRLLIENLSRELDVHTKSAKIESIKPVILQRLTEGKRVYAFHLSKKNKRLYPEFIDVASMTKHLTVEDEILEDNTTLYIWDKHWQQAERKSRVWHRVRLATLPEDSP
jgi:hypothetical protein